ncbi:OsmC family protein [Acaryochloris sp. CCMEE 5410]|uniref:OsmC family protein n=1 Tax=Acaryochloris sp. CCMEE 5410 TaxID=310037 RepID=UPI0002484479|nr:OsmC family protein [Acaryochloris sp. CCMEE 5410]KAI9134009.1 OsmC family protein [Acaryochloris sp. CCMEE 5410]
MSEVTAISPIAKDGLDSLIAKNRENLEEQKTLKVKTVCDQRMRSLNYARDLEPFVIDEPPGLLGDNTAHNPSEIVLGAFGSCLVVGIQANAAAQGISLTKLQVELEADINITSTWGTGELAKPQIGFSDVRVKVDIDGDASREVLEELVQHANTWSPVSNTLSRPMPISVSMA